MRGNRRGNAAHRALLLRTLPLRRHCHLAGVRASPPADAPEARAPRHCHLTGAGFLGKPLRAIFRFRHQDAQTPPSPLVGEGGRGDEGQQARECSTPRIAPENSTLEKARPPRGCAGVPARRRAGGARSQALPPYRGRFFGEAPARHLPFQASRRPNAPFSPCVAVLTKVEPDRQVEHSWE
jgi:hypothetical protein